MLAEFPTVAELLALAVAAGEGPVGALERVCRLTGGALARELARALGRARAGAPLGAGARGDRATAPACRRWRASSTASRSRSSAGTPLADVLRAQAADVREAGKRRAAGGRRPQGDRA